MSHLMEIVEITSLCILISTFEISDEIDISTHENENCVFQYSNYNTNYLEKRYFHTFVSFSSISKYLEDSNIVVHSCVVSLNSYYLFRSIIPTCR